MDQESGCDESGGQLPLDIRDHRHDCKTEENRALPHYP